MELLAVTSQLQIENGQVGHSSHVPGLLAQSAPSKSGRGRENDFLFAHLTLAGSFEETATLYEDLLDNISIIYYSSSGSVTAALRNAIIETNRLLLAHNLNSAATLREGAVTCAVLKGVMPVVVALVTSMPASPMALRSVLAPIKRCPYQARMRSSPSTGSIPITSSTRTERHPMRSPICAKRCLGRSTARAG